MEVAPALGCTEPVAIALGAAAAAALLKDTVTRIDVAVDPNIYKNGLAVSIPGTDGLCGLDTAAAIGAAIPLSVSITSASRTSCIFAATSAWSPPRALTSNFPEKVPQASTSSCPDPRRISAALAVRVSAVSPGPTWR